MSDYPEAPPPPENPPPPPPLPADSKNPPTPPRLSRYIIDHDQYYIRRKVLKLFGGSFHIYDTEDNLVLFSSQKAFKLKEDIRVFSDESMSSERLVVKARSMIDFGAAYDVVDSESSEKLGAFRRKGLKSILKDTWELLDNNDNPVGKLQEDSGCLGLVRRFGGGLGAMIPQSFFLEIDGKRAVTYSQRFNPFVFKMDVKLEKGARELLDPRLALAGAILLVVIEGRQG